MAEVTAAALCDMKDGAKRQVETVKVVVKGISGHDSSMARASMAGGTVEVELFDPATAWCGKETHFIPADGVVELEIPYGMHYSVCSKKAGVGASFRICYVACQAYTRWIHLWNLPLGVWKFGRETIYSDNLGDYVGRVVPIIMDDGTVSSDDYAGWDVGDGDVNDWEGLGVDPEEYSDDEYSDVGIVVSTADTSFIVAEGAKSSSQLEWSEQGFGRTIPGLDELYLTNSKDYNLGAEDAKADFSGNLNTAKIVNFLDDCPAAEFACKTNDYNLQKYLPAAGELYVLYQNKSAYNGIQSDYSDVPAIDTSYYWSSSAYSPYNSWLVSMSNGDVGNRYRDNDSYVLAFSAFRYSAY